MLHMTYYWCVLQISETVNGPMMEVLASAINYHDSGCIELFRQGIYLGCVCGDAIMICACALCIGAKMIGRLDPCGNGRPVVNDCLFDESLVDLDREQRNRKARFLPYECC